MEQRLKWACGANPDLQEVFDKFSSSLSAEMEAMRSLVGISKSLSASSNTIVHHELLRTTSREAVAADSSGLRSKSSIRWNLHQYFNLHVCLSSVTSRNITNFVESHDVCNEVVTYASLMTLSTFARRD